jgi:hypothetical protein
MDSTHTNCNVQELESLGLSVSGDAGYCHDTVPQSSTAVIKSMLQQMSSTAGGSARGQVESRTPQQAAVMNT